MKSVTGFSLIELMVAVAIVGFLAAVAYPSYTGFVREARRGEAMKELYKYANLQEQFFLDNNTYTATIGALEGTTDTTFTTESGLYSISAAAPTTSTFTLTATPVSSASQADDSDCQSFTINQAGTRTAANSGGTDTTTTCWGY